MQDETGRVRLLTDDPDELEREALRKQAEDLARLLDSAIRIPGTPIRIGLNPHGRSTDKLPHPGH